MIAVRREPRAGDDGYSLIELMVAMGIMSIVMTVVLSATIQIYQAVNRTDATSTARDAITTSFERLDKTLRYATWLSTPALVGTAWYFEYATTTDCRELKYAGGVLSLATWTLPGTTPGTPTIMASNLALVGTTAPFTVYRAGTVPYASASPGTAGVGANFQPQRDQVRLRFTVSAGTITLPIDTIFTAQNTTSLTSASNDCSAGRPSS